MSVNVKNVIAKKRDGLRLSDDEIEFIIDAISKNAIDQAQIGALLMAIRLREMDDGEMVQLTRCMTKSGDVLDWPASWRHLVVDKHSTGGIGDKTSLVLAPALAACGLKVPMVSGRGLGHTGGTLDKLESIPGFNVSLTASQIRNVVEEVGCCIVGQTSRLAPADAVMYAARDVTETVDSIPLIVGSIISKKAAESPAALILDVKTGKAAVMSDENDARHLAEKLVTVGKGQGIRTTALLTKMDSPIGNTAGHALEVAEAIECLHGGGPRSFVDLITHLGGHLLNDAGLADSPLEGIKLIESTLADGRALAKFRVMIQSQGVASDVADALCKRNADVFTILPAAKFQTPVKASKTGYIVEIDAMICANVYGQHGGSRFQASDVIDFAVGLRIERHVGSHVTSGETVMILHTNREPTNDDITKLSDAVVIQAEQPTHDVKRLILDVIN